MFVREDWKLFRNLVSLGQKAGVGQSEIGALVIKELVDNALDAHSKVRVTEANGWVTIEDNGPGIDHDLITDLFSIARPLTSSKIVRLPLRGALGNGLRVVMGAVYASNGAIVVETGGKQYNLIPHDNGTTTAHTVFDSDKTQGTKISIRLGDAIDTRKVPLMTYANIALSMAELGTTYTGKTSPWWYDAASFFDVLDAAGDTPVSEICSLFRGINGASASKLANGRLCSEMTSTDATELLTELRLLSKKVKPQVLGSIDDLPGYHRASASGEIKLGSVLPAELPFVLEVFAEPLESYESDALIIMVNRTPITGATNIWRNKPAQLAISGCGLYHAFEVPKTPMRLVCNITTPYMPITTDGKAPDLKPYLEWLWATFKKAASKAKRSVAKTRSDIRVPQKDYIQHFLDEAIADASGDGEYRYSLRQLYYAIRPMLEGLFENELEYNYFANVITDIEAMRGKDLPGLYRDARGVIVHPHTGEEIALGTLNAEKYRRPAWTFNKILYCEKEGLLQVLKSSGWLERNDCAFMTSKGYASRAVRDVIDYLGDGEEELYFFCIHDADASGTMIYETLTSATRARRARRVHVVNLGLDPQEAEDMGLPVETFRTAVKKKHPVAKYIDGYWADWLQTHRVELNAMSSPAFIKWLDAKMAPYVDKVIPPKKVMWNALDDSVEAVVRETLTARILREAGLDDLVEQYRNRIMVEIPVDVESVVQEGLAADAHQRWTAPLRIQAEQMAREVL